MSADLTTTPLQRSHSSPQTETITAETNGSWGAQPQWRQLQHCTCITDSGTITEGYLLENGDKIWEGMEGPGPGRGCREEREVGKWCNSISAKKNILKLPIQQNVKHWVEAHGYGEGVWNTMSCFWCGFSRFTIPIILSHPSTPLSFLIVLCNCFE